MKRLIFFLSLILLLTLSNIAYAGGIAPCCISANNWQVQLPDGSAAAPPISFSSNPDTGFFLDGSEIWFAIDGGSVGRLASSFISVPTTLRFSTSEDVRIEREAADVLSLKRELNAQTFKIYESYTDTSNYERYALIAGSDRLEIKAETLGTGADNLDIVLTTAGTGKVKFTGGFSWAAGAWEFSGGVLYGDYFRLRGGTGETHYIGTHEGNLELKASSEIAGDYNIILTPKGTGKVGIGITNPDGQLSTGLANGQQISYKSLTELTTIAAAATTDTVIQIPANVIVKAVSVRVTVAIPTAATFTVTGAGSSTTFNTAAVSVAVNSTNKGNLNCPYNNGAAQLVRITPSATPADTTGRVRVTIWYEDSIPPTS